MNAELSTYRQWPLRLFIGVVLILFVASWASVAVAASGPEPANPDAAGWELNMPWAVSGAALASEAEIRSAAGWEINLPWDVSGAALALEAENRDAAGWEINLPWDVSGEDSFELLCCRLPPFRPFV
jgi:hypothetical protein